MNNYANIVTYLKNDKRRKSSLINQNIHASKYGQYKECKTARPIKCFGMRDFNAGPINSVCEVQVFNAHSIDVASNYCAHGFNAGYINFLNPCCVCVVGREFCASNYPASEGIRDDIFNLRTNLNATTDFVNPYPIKDNESVYNPFLTVIRNINMDPLNYQSIFKFGLIVSSPINKPVLLSDDKMSSTDFLHTLENIKTIFQTAINAKHNVLILPPYGHVEDDVPQEDIIKIYNSCIFEYGHKFKIIAIAIPPWDGKNLYELYNNGIVRPQMLVKKIDDKYDKEKYIQMVKKNNNPKEVKKEVSNKDEQMNKMFQMFMSMMNNQQKG
uniref:Macro domain-containing protein n=1 Tax=viral metagenome TaxID=1070528 RepID=A0A6C0E9D6_9ZZZZ